jgi:hypothetical protein
MLAEWGHVEVDNRDVEVRDVLALSLCTRSTWRDADLPPDRSAAPAAAWPARHVLEHAEVPS